MKSRRMICSILLLAAAVVLMSVTAAAMQEDEDLEQWISGSGLPETFSALSERTMALMAELGVGEVSAAGLLSLSPKAFFRLLFHLAVDRLLHPLKSAALLTGIALVCAAAEAVRTEGAGKSVEGAVGVVGALCCSAAVLSPAMAVIENVCAAISECSRFLLSFIPVHISVLTAGGQMASAAAGNALLFGISQLYSELAEGIVKPLTGIFMAFSMVGAVCREMGTGKLAGSVRKTVTWALALASTVFVGILTLQGTVSASMDSVSAKTVKFAVSSTVPMVGGALSEAIGSAIGYIGLLRSVTGTFGILAGAAVFLPVLTDTVLWQLSMSLAATAAEMLGMQPVSETARAAADVFGILFALVLCMLLTVTVVMGMTLTIKG